MYVLRLSAADNTLLTDPIQMGEIPVRARTLARTS